jgi:hypothetical protein
MTAPKPVGIADAAAIFMLGLLAREGRAAGLHIIADTQNATNGLWGSTTTRMQIDTAVCFRVSGQYDAGAALPAGSNLRPYLTLTRPGDCYLALGSRITRAYVAHIPEAQQRALLDTATPELHTWPDFDANDLEGFEAPRSAGQPAKGFDAVEIASALAMLKRNGDKRVLLRNELGGLSNSRAGDLLKLARELAGELSNRGYCSSKKRRPSVRLLPGVLKCHHHPRRRHFDTPRISGRTADNHKGERNARE